MYTDKVIVLLCCDATARRRFRNAKATTFGEYSKEEVHKCTQLLKQVANSTV